MDEVNDIRALCVRSAHRHIMLSTEKLKLKYESAVKKEHKIALDQLTKILNRDQTKTDVQGPTFQHSKPLHKHNRVIKNPQILSELTSD